MMRELLVSLLLDEHGVSEEGFKQLYPMLVGHPDIMNGIKAADGRFYLPENWEPTDPVPPYKEWDFRRMVETIIPGSSVEMDNSGQVVVYTGQMVALDGAIVDWEEGNPHDRT